MAENHAFNTVKVDNGTMKRSRFNLNHPASFTLPFGWVAPTMCQKMVQNSKHIVSSKQLCRLKPLVLPVSQGEIEVQTLHHFVGMSDIYRHYAEYQAKQPYQAASGSMVTMTKLPHMRLCDLSVYVLVGAKIGTYIDDAFSVNGLEQYHLPSVAEQTSIVNALQSLISQNYILAKGSNSPFDGRFPDYCDNTLSYRVYPEVFNPLWSVSGSKFTIPCANLGGGGDIFNSDSTLENADYVLYRDDIVWQSGQTTPTPLAFTFSLSDYGKRLAFILDMLGYGVDFTSTEEVDLTRLFAEYIAYYGAFGLSKYTNYQSTPCAKFLRMYEEGCTMFDVVGLGYPSSNVIPDPTMLNTTFVQLLNDIVTQFATDKVDYISSHRISDVTTVNETGWLDNVVYATGGSALSIGQRSGSADDHTAVQLSTMSPYIDRVNHTQVDADLLKLLYKITNRNTVAGRRIAELLRAGGYGKYVDEQQSHFIGKSSYNINFADINATADATSAAGKTSYLGAYVGKGVGAAPDSEVEKKFVWETDEVGYWITLTCVIPDSSYCQQTDLTVLDVEPEQQFSSEYDSLGYEIHPKRVYKNGSDWTVTGASHTSSPLDAGFGLVPREMRYKVSRGVIAGEFKRRPTRDEILPFVLCRYIDLDNKYVKSVSSTGIAYGLSSTAKVTNAPLASQAWRFINKYPWLANFERIFAYLGDNWPAGYASAALMSRYIFASFTDDYFLCFTYYFHSAEMPALPIEQSYSTTDDNDGNGTDMSVA